MSKKILLFSFAIIASICCPAQKPSDRDSLYKIISMAKTDSAIAANYLHLSWLYLHSNFDSSALYADKAETIAEKSKLTTLIIECKTTKAINHSLFRKHTL